MGAPDDPEFAETLSRRRREAGLTQEELAERSGISARTIAYLERRRVGTPRPGTARLLAEGLGLQGSDRAHFMLAAAGAAPARVTAPTHPARRPTQLPHVIPDFTGRADILARLDTLLEREGGSPVVGPTVVAITGAAGVGKTTLALYWAHRVQDHFPDGQLFANLRGHDRIAPLTAHEVLDQFLRALGVPATDAFTDEVALAALFRSAVNGRHLLIVLDNVRDSVQVRSLLPGSATCTVLITSRCRLSGLAARDGAMIIPVPGMATVEAIDLLRRRVGVARVDAERQQAAAVAHLCAYLPLALRLAADRIARLNGLSLAATAHELADEANRLDVLAASDDATTAVRSVLSWTYAALDAMAARMFRLLGLLPAGEIGFVAAGVLAGTDSRTARQWLTRLADVHLINEVRPGRYAIHDLLRLYAAELSTTHDSPQSRDQARRRLHRWYLHTARNAGARLLPHRYDLPPRQTCGPSHPALTFTTCGEALTWCETERANLTAAVLQAAQTGDTGLAAQMALALTGFYMIRPHWHDWITTHQAALDAAEATRRSDLQARLLNSMGSACTDLRRFEEAITHLHQALRICRATGDTHTNAVVLLNLGWVNQLQHLYPEATKILHQALDLFRATADRYGQGRALHRIGEVHLHQGEILTAVTILNQALTIFEETSNAYGKALTLDSLGQAYHALSQYTQAQRYLNEALAVRRGTGNIHGEAVTLHHLACLHQDMGDQPAAHQSWTASLSILNVLQAPLANQVRERLADGDTS